MTYPKRKASVHDLQQESNEKLQRYQEAVNLAHQYFKENKFAETKEQWHLALENAPDKDSELYCKTEMATLFQTYKLYNDASRYWNQVANLTNSHTAWKNAAMCYEKHNIDAGRAECYTTHMAFMWLTAAKTAEKPEEGIAYLNKVFNLSRSEKIVKAAQEYLLKFRNQLLTTIKTLKTPEELESIFIQTHDEECRLKILELLTQSKHYGVAAKCWDKLANDTQSSFFNTKKANYWLNAADMYAKSKDTANEIRCLKARAFCTRLPEHLEDLAQAYFTNKQLLDAANIWVRKATLTSHPGDWRKAINTYYECKPLDISSVTKCLRELMKIYQNSNLLKFLECSAEIFKLTENPKDAEGIDWQKLYDLTSEPGYKTMAAAEIAENALDKAEEAIHRNDANAAITSYQCANKYFILAKFSSKSADYDENIAHCKDMLYKLQHHEALAFLKQIEIEYTHRTRVQVRDTSLTLTSESRTDISFTMVKSS